MFGEIHSLLVDLNVKISLKMWNVLGFGLIVASGGQVTFKK
jgi:hypothetical protein